MLRAVPDFASARSTSTHSLLSPTPFAHHRYATRFPSANASGPQRFLRSGLSRTWSDGVLSTITSKREGLSATSVNGLPRTAAATSFPVRTATRGLTPNFDTECLLDPSSHIATPIVWLREDDVATIEQRADITKAKTLNKRP